MVKPLNTPMRIAARLRSPASAEWDVGHKGSRIMLNSVVFFNPSSLNILAALWMAQLDSSRRYPAKLRALEIVPLIALLVAQGDCLRDHTLRLGLHRDFLGVGMNSSDASVSHAADRELDNASMECCPIMSISFL